MSQLVFDLAAKAHMFDHATKGYPEEICGFLLGSEDGDRRFIQEVLPVRNSKETNRQKRFEIAPEDYMYGEKYALEHDFSLLGIYHTHPDHPALPSKHDYNQAVPFFSYVIISVGATGPRKVTSWQLNEHRNFAREKINDIETKTVYN